MAAIHDGGNALKQLISSALGADRCRRGERIWGLFFSLSDLKRYRCCEMGGVVECGGDECGCGEYCVGMGSG
ncbi:Hypothetical predicted protein [Olea europaea subsp. europaea]|uniref:Uncharacterized protein n=1 Tax=Olea europaea subsp. europaea TaxID=158383 RepID=A0A8S0QGT3_OLEEU|nr:Hypothetical predicted protein [Olea europaea subsp. europaea]